MDNEKTVGRDWESEYHRLQKQHEELSCMNKEIRHHNDGLQVALDTVTRQKEELETKKEEMYHKMLDLVGYTRGLEFAIEHFGNKNM